jgi:histidinol dehydrogenase
MLTRLNASAPDFDARLRAALSDREASNANVAPIVSDIIADVRARGDVALIDYTAKFDSLSLTTDTLRISAEEIKAARKECPADVVTALDIAAKRLRDFHEKQIPRDILYTDELGVRLGMRWSAISDVGIYVPGGRASYPSSVLHNAIPARVAGVSRLVMVVPTPKGEINPAVLVAAELAGVDEIYRIGGAQAVAALAYGTDTIKPVYKIVGPGNAFVAEAKRQVFGKVGIDMIAGPSEILVVSDAGTNPAWVAADLLSQAEHDPIAQSILITDSAQHADAVDAALQATLTTLPRREIAEASIRDFGLSIVIDKMSDAPALINIIAPEHLELAVENPDTLLPHIHHAGAIFIGRYTPEALGDYLAGPSHVLPTSQTAHFSSGLSVYDFVKKTSLLGASKEAFAQLGAHVATLADSEGLGAHALSARIRLEP